MSSSYTTACFERWTFQYKEYSESYVLCKKQHFNKKKQTFVDPVKNYEIINIKYKWKERKLRKELETSKKR